MLVVIVIIALSWRKTRNRLCLFKLLGSSKVKCSIYVIIACFQKWNEKLMFCHQQQCNSRICPCLLSSHCCRNVYVLVVFLSVQISCRNTPYNGLIFGSKSFELWASVNLRSTICMPLIFFLQSFRWAGALSNNKVAFMVIFWFCKKVQISRKE